MDSRSQIYHADAELRDDLSYGLAAKFIEASAPWILDVGCACGDIGKAYKGRFPDATLVGCDLDAGSLEIARQSGAYAKLIQLDLDRIDSAAISEFQNRFDYLYCGDVLEHLRCPMDSLDALLGCLKPGGSLLSSIPNVAHLNIKCALMNDDFTYTPVGLLDQTHVHLFTYRSIASGFASIGLRIEDARFTFVNRDGWRPHVYWDGASPELLHAYYDDWHSYVCQYVTRSVRSDLPQERLEEINLEALRIDGTNAPEPMRAYRARMLADCPPRGIDLYRDKCAEYDTKCAEYDAKCHSLSDELARVLALYDEMRLSTCWRMTGPLRWTLDRLKGLVRR